MNSKQSWTSLIHVAKRELDLNDADYRAVLATVGITSSKDLKSEAQFDRVMAELKAMGFVKSKATKRPAWKDNWWRCSDAKRAKIEVLWANVARTPTPEALRRMVARIIHIDRPEWINDGHATKVILALRAMAVQAGLDPNAAERPREAARC